MVIVFFVEILGLHEKSQENEANKYEKFLSVKWISLSNKNNYYMLQEVICKSRGRALNLMSRQQTSLGACVTLGLI